MQAITRRSANCRLSGPSLIQGKLSFQPSFPGALSFCNRSSEIPLKGNLRDILTFIEPGHLFFKKKKEKCPLTFCQLDNKLLFFPFRSVFIFLLEIRLIDRVLMARWSFNKVCWAHLVPLIGMRSDACHSTFLGNFVPSWVMNGPGPTSSGGGIGVAYLA